MNLPIPGGHGRFGRDDLPFAAINQDGSVNDFLPPQAAPAALAPGGFFATLPSKSNGMAAIILNQSSSFQPSSCKINPFRNPPPAENS
jgi:hypothetical protein